MLDKLPNDVVIHQILALLDVGDFFRIQSLSKQIQLNGLSSSQRIFNGSHTRILNTQLMRKLSHAKVRLINVRFSQHGFIKGFTGEDNGWFDSVESMSFKVTYRNIRHCNSAVQNAINLRSLRVESLEWFAAFCVSGYILAFLPPTLLDLNMCGCDWMSKYAFRHIAQHCRNLTRLSLSGCRYLRDSEFIPILRACAQLTDIDVSHCPQLGHDSVFALTQQHAGILRRVSVRGCYELRIFSIHHLANACPGLLTLDVIECSRLTEQDLEFLRAIIVVPRQEAYRQLHIDASEAEVAANCLKVFSDTPSEAMHHRRRHNWYWRIVIAPTLKGALCYAVCTVLGSVCAPFVPRVLLLLAVLVISYVASQHLVHAHWFRGGYVEIVPLEGPMVVVQPWWI